MRYILLSMIAVTHWGWKDGEETEEVGMVGGVKGVAEMVVVGKVGVGKVVRGWRG